MHVAAEGWRSAKKNTEGLWRNNWVCHYPFALPLGIRTNFERTQAGQSTPPMIIGTESDLS